MRTGRNFRFAKVRLGSPIGEVEEDSGSDEIIPQMIRGIAARDNHDGDGIIGGLVEAGL